MKQHSSRFWTTGCVALSLMASPSPTQAQLTSDGTLSTNIATPNNLDFTITGGSQAGANLFHSFSEFSVPSAGSAFFNHAPEIQNIISRVTGTSASDINGLLRTNPNGTANLFLINPNGIVFGGQARLDIKGSFVATTANAIQFGNQGFFNASVSDVPPLLTVNPSAFLFNQIAAKSITYQSNNQTTAELRVPQGQSLLLVGGEVRLNGGKLTAPGGRVDLGGVSGVGTVRLNGNNNSLGLSFPDGVARADVWLKETEINVLAGGGGSIAINSQNLNVVDGDLKAGIGAGLGAKDAQAGDIALNARGVIVLEGSLISNEVQGTRRARGTGNAGNILLDAQSLSTNGTQISTITSGQGNAGSIVIQVNSSVSLVNESNIFSSVGSRGVGDGGNIWIDAKSLSLTNASLNTNTFGQGDAGGILVQADDHVSLTQTILSSAVEPNAIGNAGDINIQTGTLTLTDNTRLFTSTFGTGRSGNVILNARDIISLVNSRIFSDTRPSAQGNGGDIAIATRLLSLTDAGLFTITSGQGDAGMIHIKASDSVSVSRVNPNPLDSIGLFTNTTADRNAGKLLIETGQLSVQGGARISASTSGSGQGGTLSVIASDFVELVGTSSDGKSPSGLFTVSINSGAAGNLSISTGQLVLRDGAEVSVSSEGLGKAGSIEIVADLIELYNPGSLTAETKSGNGGNITLNVEDLLLLRNNSNISTDAGTAQAGGDGGNIEINVPLIVAVLSEDSDITANAYEGRGGNIQIKAEGIFGIRFRERQTPESDITASSDLGVDGVVEINTPDVDPSRGLTAIPIQLVDASRLVASDCGVVARRGQSKFVVTGRGGLPPSPNETLSSDTVWSDLRLPTQQAETRSHSAITTLPANPPASPLVEAQGWVINDNGEVVLTASTPHRSGLISPECRSF